MKTSTRTQVASRLPSLLSDDDVANPSAWINPRNKGIFLMNINKFFMLIVIACAFGTPAHAQSFSLDTSVMPDGSQFDYAFTLNYDQQGIAQALTDNIWDWSFYVDPTAPAPTDVVTPVGWQYNYDPNSGELDLYTQGPNGFGSGDFGPNVILPGDLLSGFAMTTADAPDLSVAFADDVQFNQDDALATLPTSPLAPPPSGVAVPEPSSTALAGLGLTMLTLPVMIARGRRMATQ